MKKRYIQFSKNWHRIGLVTAISLFPYLGLQAQTAPAKLWDKTIGGSGNDLLSIVKQTADGGYIMGGGSDGGINGDKSQASQGGQDYWVVKTDASGVKTWDKTFGGSGFESLRFMQQTTDGGYILAGYSDSGLSGDKSQASKGSNDFWVVKIDATGNKQWDKTLGGSGDDKLFAVQQTTDGGYILSGTSTSGISGDKTQASKGGVDFWVIKLDGSGNKTWDKTFGGSTVDNLYTIQQTTDGGYILAGSSDSGISGDKTQASKGGMDYWVIKIDGSGNKTWDKTLGGSADEITLLSVQQTTDGGYILGGYSMSGISGDKTQASKGGWDCWIVKLDGSGNKTWDKTYGGNDSDNLRSLQQTSDGGYIFGAPSLSGISGDKTQASKGGNDYWIVKLDGSGNKTWDKVLGGSGADFFNSLQQTSDGGYIIGGYSDSGLNGDKGQASKGSNDNWIIKLAGPAPIVPVDLGVTAITGVNSGCNLTNQETITISVNNMGTASQSNIPVSYKINNGTPVSEVLAGPLAPNSTVNYTFATKANLSAAGTYSIEARTSLSGDALPANDVITKVVSSYAVPNVPTVTSGSTSFCSGSNVTLTAASTTTGATYQWYLNGTAINGATSASYTANTAGSYTATAIVGGSCASPASAATTLTVKTTPAAPSLSASGSYTICTGDSVTLTASSATPGVTYNWFKNGNLIAGVTTAIYKAKTSGTYTVTATANGCGSPVSIARTVTVNSIPFTPTVTQSGSVLTSSASTGNQWYKNNAIIPGATAKNYTVTSSGTYKAVVTINNCSSLPSNSVNMTIAGLGEDMAGLDVKVYPNPSNGLYSIELPQGKDHEITVTDLTGKVMSQLFAKDKNTQLNISGAAKGIYFLKIKGEGKTAMRKLVVE